MTFHIAFAVSLPTGLHSVSSVSDSFGASPLTTSTPNPVRCLYNPTMRIPKKSVSFCFSLFSPDFPAPFHFPIFRVSSRIPPKPKAIHAAGVSWSISWKILRLGT